MLQGSGRNEHCPDRAPARDPAEKPLLMLIVEPAWVFLGLSVLFAVLAAREYRNNDGELNVAGRNWRRMAVTFGVIAAVLLVLRFRS